MLERYSKGALWGGFALIVVPCIGLVGLSVYQATITVPELREGREYAAGTLEVISTARALERALGDTERGQRNFLITDDPLHLRSYRDGIDAIPTLLSKLTELTQDNDEHQRRLPILRGQIQARLDALKRAIEIGERDGGEAARAWVRQNHGADIMRSTLSLIEATVAVERSWLAEYLDQIAGSEEEAATIGVTGSVLALLAMAAGLLLVVVAFRGARQAEMAQRESTERFGQLVKSLPDHAIVPLDARGYVTDWNVGAERIKGYSATEIVGQHFSRFYTPEDRAAGAPDRAIETAVREGTFEAEAWRVRKDGTRFLASVVIDPVRNDKGELVGFAKITRDITARRRQQDALDQSRAALAQLQKMDAVGQLTGGIAHDFNNLLTIIIGSVDLLQKRLRDADPELRRFADIARRGGERAAALTQRLLAFARRQPLDPKPLDPNRLVVGMEDLLRRALGEQIALETVLGAGVWKTSVDANQLESAILNLAVNARDAMPGGGKLTIETANALLDEAYAAAHAEVTPGQYVMIAVSDTGTGMTPEVVAKAFEPFFTTKQGGQGAGLGLSQVFGFIKQSGGHVKIYSEAGQGTTVKLYLRRVTAQEEAEPPPRAPKSKAASGSGTVLVVEDDADVRAFAAEVLARLGYRVLMAPDAAGALALLEREGPVDLLFTDVGLPGGVNGRELADEALRRRPGLKVLFTTGYARNAIIHHGRLDPGVALIVKPFTEDTLAEKVLSVLEEEGRRN